MTTIAWDGKYLSSDSMVTNQSVHCGRYKKLVIIKDKIAVAMAGDLKMFEILLPYIKNIYLGLPEDKNNFEEISKYFDKYNENIEFEMTIFYFKKEICYDIYSNSLIPVANIKSSLYASGSGKLIALGAMKAGANSMEAINITSELDVYTDNKIVSYNIEELLKCDIDPNYNYVILEGN